MLLNDLKGTETIEELAKLYLDGNIGATTWYIAHTKAIERNKHYENQSDTTNNRD